MRYQRPKKGEVISNEFSLGTHQAKIESVINKPSKKGSKMFRLNLVGNNGEKGMYFLVFGNDYTEKNLTYILVSIEDNGVDIPDMKFGHNRSTLEFLEGKDVYIRVEEKPFNGEVKPTVTEFLALDEFEESEVSDDSFDDDDF